MKLSLITISLFLFLGMNAQDVQAGEKQKAVNEIFSAWDSDEAPGAGVGIFEDGEVIFAGGYGMANLEHNIAIDENSVFRIGSTSKQFTGACIVLLEMQGKLSFSDSLYKYFPEFPAYAKEVTIQHLLSHTSGIRDYLSLARLKGLRHDYFYQDSDVESWLAAQKELNFKPGEDDMYSNSGYWLLGQIVKKVSGMDMAEYAEQEIFKPLGMNNTHFHNDHTLIVKNRASGYTPAKEPNTYSISMTTLDMIGDGGIFTSISDIKKWDDAYYHSDVLGPEFWQAMTRKGELNNGKKLNYGAGLVVDEYKGLKIISHGGAFVGFRAELLRFPEEKFTVAVFANRGDADPTSKAYQVADVYLAEEFKVKAQSDSKDVSTKASPTTADTKTKVKFSTEQMVGNYELRAGRQLLITADKGILHVYQLWNHSEYDLEAIDSDSNTYQIGDDESLSFTFIDLQENQTQAISVIQGNETTWKRVEPVDVSAVDVNDFIGSFYSEELDVIYDLSVVDEKLYVSVKDNDSAEVTVADIDELLLNNSLAEIFREQGQVKGFLLDAGRVKNIKFVKK